MSFGGLGILAIDEGVEVVPCGLVLRCGLGIGRVQLNGSQGYCDCQETTNEWESVDRIRPTGLVVTELRIDGAYYFNLRVKPERAV